MQFSYHCTVGSQGRMISHHLPKISMLENKNVMDYFKNFVHKDFLSEQLPIVVIGVGLAYFILIALKNRKNKTRD